MNFAAIFGNDFFVGFLEAAHFRAITPKVLTSFAKRLRACYPHFSLYLETRRHFRSLIIDFAEDPVIRDLLCAVADGGLVPYEKLIEQLMVGPAHLRSFLPAADQESALDSILKISVRQSWLCMSLIFSHQRSTWFDLLPPFNTASISILCIGAI
jgi:hypothetical protein